MKTILSVIAALAFSGQVLAASATPSAATTPKTGIDDLKDRLATKVAELRQSQKKAIYGSVKATSVSTFTVETQSSDIKIELTDEIKVFQTIKGKRTELTTDDLAKGDSVVVFGDYDTGLELLKAKVVVIVNPLPLKVHGVISDIDTKNFTVTLTTPEGSTYVIDIERTTSMLMFDKEKGIIKGGFSKLEKGKSAHVVGTPDAKEERRISALRFLDIGYVTGTTPTPTPTEEASPSASPSATPKATVTPKPTP